jgi:mannonate dehydratase
MPTTNKGWLSRRDFLAASGAALSVAALAEPPLGKGARVSNPADGIALSKQTAEAQSGLKIAEIFSPPENALWRMIRQCGVNQVVGSFTGKWDKERAADEKPWSFGPLARLKQAYEQGGFELAVIESRPPMNKIKLGLPGRDDEIAEVCTLLQNMGKLKIPVWCYEWMPVIGWLRTRKEIRSRGGALVTGFDLADLQTAPLTAQGTVKEEKLWTNLKYFLERVVPVAEQAKVKLAMHPDDPPLSPIRGLGRIMRSVDNYQRLLDLVPSPVNGITLCQGNFTLMTKDLPGVIRHFGRQQKIFFVHFRDVRGTPEKFEETFHDDGQTDMAACMRAYRDIGYQGVCRPDHVPTMEGDSNSNPGYSSIGRLFAIGYLKGLLQAVDSEKPVKSVSEKS